MIAGQLLEVKEKMRKVLILMALVAASGIASFSAPACLTGVSLQALANAGLCTITNGAFSWDINNWALTERNTTGYSGVLPTASEFTVTISNIANGVNSLGAGFAVTVTNPNNTWFNTLGGGTSVNQSNNYKVNYQIVSGSSIVRIDNSIEGQGGTGQVNIQKLINTLGGSNLGEAHVFYTGNPVSLLTFNPATFTPNSGLTSASIVDHVIVSAANQPQGGYLSSFTNSFQTAALPPPPQNGIPEPMTFVLMGAGLVGIAALRRRS
jgi:hypothetical protein